ncbi:MAG: 50S ribosomal protein L16 [Chloroflexota bacterium]
MLQPSRVKYRKTHLGRLRGKAVRANTMAFGAYGLQAEKSCWLTARQIEAARRAITHHLKRGGTLWIRVFPDVSVTKKPAETRMGGGKGNPERWVMPVKAGRVIFELGNDVEKEVAEEAFRLAAHKLPAKTKLIYAEGNV